MVPRSWRMSAPWRFATAMYIASKPPPGALMVIEVETLSSGNLVEQLLHVANGRDRNAHLAHLALRDRIVRIVPDLSRQVERDAQPRLTLLQQIAIALIGLLRRGEPRILTHRPEARTIHRRLDSARVRIFAREAELLKILLVETVVETRQRHPRDLNSCRGLEALFPLLEFFQRLLERGFFPFFVLFVDCHILTTMGHKGSRRKRFKTFVFLTCTPWHRPPGQVCARCKCRSFVVNLDFLKYKSNGNKPVG